MTFIRSSLLTSFGRTLFSDPGLGSRNSLGRSDELIKSYTIFSNSVRLHLNSNELSKSLSGGRFWINELSFYWFPLFYTGKCKPFVRAVSVSCIYVNCYLICEILPVKQFYSFSVPDFIPLSVITLTYLVLTVGSFILIWD